jgi:hypothetical protein
MLKNSNQFVAMECFENKTRGLVKIRRPADCGYSHDIGE